MSEFLSIYDSFQYQPDEEEMLEGFGQAIPAIVRDVQDSKVVADIARKSVELENIIHKGVQFANEVKHKAGVDLNQKLEDLGIDAHSLISAFNKATNALNNAYNAYLNVDKAGKVAQLVTGIHGNSLTTGIVVTGSTILLGAFLNLLKDLPNYWNKTHVSMASKINHELRDLLKEQQETTNYSEIPKLQQAIKERKSFVGAFSTFLSTACRAIDGAINKAKKAIAATAVAGAAVTTAIAIDAPIKAASSVVTATTKGAKDDTGKEIHKKAKAVSNYATKNIRQKGNIVRRTAEYMNPLKNVKPETQSKISNVNKVVRRGGKR